MPAEIDQKNKRPGLFSELRRRRVLQSSAIYVAAAWALVQVADTTFPMFELPDVYTKYVTLALIAGFPVAVILAWIFDIGPGWFIRTPAHDETPNAAPVAASKSDHYTLSETAAPARSIAVMPFVNVGQSEDNEFLSDGIAEELLTLLCRATDLKVAARTSSFAFKDSKTDIREVAARLGVRHIVEGSVRRAADRVRISVQFVEAQSGYQLWSASFDRKIDDIFAVQDEIASAIVHALKVALDESQIGDGSVHSDAPTDDIEAYQFYLRGLHLWQRRGATAVRGAISALEQAVDKDAEFAEAIALLAIAHAALHEFSDEDREIGFAIADKLARRAMEIDPQMGKPHAVLGYMAMRRWQWSAADKSLRMALALEPHEPMFHQWYSNLLNDLAYHDKALFHALSAYNCDRLSPQANNILALNFVVLGRNDAARKHVTVTREFGLGGPLPDYVDYLIYLRKGDYDAARALLHRSVKRRKMDNAWVDATIDALAQRGDAAVACQAIDAALQVGRIAPSMALLQYVLLGQSELSFALAERSLDDQSLVHMWFLLPEARPLRDDPRFARIIERMGIVEHWRTHGTPEVAKSLPGWQASENERSTS